MKTRRRRFDGWRVVLVGALIVAIASNPVGVIGLPRMAEIALEIWPETPILPKPLFS